ncbi:hypothetical protein HS048_35345 [Planomonospora sp. ID91781]|uniref:hypothetical protein n=1 Tax=Planomonospora sp. ID91781 TaxID=2738135 RepID=UPI0018C3F11D|nr:hypothetical protein [Planomonospora sp. ID91781]MBG0825950.1 hypothetical protein [Planomonospora sp. ID91781]
MVWTARRSHRPTATRTNVRTTRTTPESHLHYHAPAVWRTAGASWPAWLMVSCLCGSLAISRTRSMTAAQSLRASCPPPSGCQV